MNDRLIEKKVLQNDSNGLQQIELINKQSLTRIKSPLLDDILAYLGNSLGAETLLELCLEEKTQRYFLKARFFSQREETDKILKKYSKFLIDAHFLVQNVVRFFEDNSDDQCFIETIDISTQQIKQMQIDIFHQSQIDDLEQSTNEILLQTNEKKLIQKTI